VSRRETSFKNIQNLTDLKLLTGSVYTHTHTHTNLTDSLRRTDSKGLFIRESDYRGHAACFLLGE